MLPAGAERFRWAFFWPVALCNTFHVNRLQEFADATTVPLTGVTPQGILVFAI